MKEYCSFIEGTKKDATRVEPVLKHLRQIIYNYPPNKYPEPIPSSFQVTNKPYLSGIEWFFLWDGRPIVISVFQADPEWVVDHILYPIRLRYNNYYEMEVWEDIQKILWKTMIGGVRVMVQLINALNCEWKESGQKPTYRLNCT